MSEYLSADHPARAERKSAAMKAWADAERRIGKYVTLDKDTLEVLIACPPDMLVETVRSRLSAM